MLKTTVFSFVVTCVCLNYGRCSRLTKHLPADSQNINIVGLFGENEEEERIAFEAAVNDVNRDSSMLRRTNLISHIEEVDLKNAYTIKGKLCKALLADSGVTALFGANSFEGVSLVQSIAETLRIPYFFSVWDALTYANGTSFNLYPQIETISEAIETIIHDMDWTSFTLLYDKDEDFLIFQDLLMKHEEYENEDNYNPIVLKQLPEDEADLKPLLKEIQNSSETRIVLSCSRFRVIDILRKAQSLRLMGDYFAYVIISLVDVTIPGQEWYANVKKVEQLEQENACLKRNLKSVEDLVDDAKTVTSNLEAVSRLRTALEYLERKLYVGDKLYTYVHYHQAFKIRNYRWNWILTHSLDPHVQILKNILRQKVEVYSYHCAILKYTDLLESFVTLVCVICTAFSNVQYPYCYDCEQTYSAENVMSSLTGFGIIHGGDDWWVQDIIFAITGFQCFKSPIVEVNQGPPKTSTSASASATASASASFAASSSFVTSSRDTP